MSQTAQVQMRLVFESNKSILKLISSFYNADIKRHKVKNYGVYISSNAIY